MDINFHNNLSAEDQVKVLHPIFIDFMKKVISAYSTKHDLDLNSSATFFIKSEREMGDLCKPHVMSQAWEIFDSYFCKKSPLFCFIEKPPTGLISTKPKLWFFPDASLAKSFFFLQGGKPSEFNKTNIEQFPHFDFTSYLSEEIKSLSSESKLRAFEILELATFQLGIAEKFLSEQECGQIYKDFRASLSECVKREIIEIKQTILAKPQAHLNLEKRLKRIFKIGWQFYRLDNPLENSYYKRILSPERDQKIKGLGLAQKKVEDYLQE